MLYCIATKAFQIRFLMAVQVYKRYSSCICSSTWQHWHWQHCAIGIIEALSAIAEAFKLISTGSFGNGSSGSHILHHFTHKYTVEHYFMDEKCVYYRGLFLYIRLLYYMGLHETSILNGSFWSKQTRILYGSFLCTLLIWTYPCT